MYYLTPNLGIFPNKNIRGIYRLTKTKRRIKENVVIVDFCDTDKGRLHV